MTELQCKIFGLSMQKECANGAGAETLRGFAVDSTTWKQTLKPEYICG